MVKKHLMSLKDMQLDDMLKRMNQTELLERHYHKIKNWAMLAFIMFVFGLAYGFAIGIAW